MRSGRALGVAVALTLCLVALGVGHAAPQGAGQAAAEQTPMSDKYFKNVQLLRGIPVDEFMDTMGMFAAATGMNCVDCHVAESDGTWPKSAEDNDYVGVFERIFHNQPLADSAEHDDSSSQHNCKAE